MRRAIIGGLSCGRTANAQKVAFIIPESSLVALHSTEFDRDEFLSGKMLEYLYKLKTHVALRKKGCLSRNAGIVTTQRFYLVDGVG